MAHSIAVLGLGIIGSRAAGCLAQAGHQVHTWNRTPVDRPDAFACAADAVSGVDFIALYLKDGTAVREVFGRIAEAVTPEQTVLNHSTIDLDTTRWLEAQCREIGCPFLDAPFTGSKVASANGELVYYVGGEEETLNSARHLLEATSKEIRHLGPVGSATVVKLATNLISATTVQALSEALALARHHGIRSDVFSECVASNACGSVLASMKLPAMAASDYDTHFSLENMLKDSRFALELAREADIDTPGIRTVSDCMANRCEKGDAQLDFSALFKAYE